MTQTANAATTTIPEQMRASVLTGVKTLNIETNFPQDWVEMGYPADASR